MNADEQPVMLWSDVPEDQRTDGSYQGYGPTAYRGCAAAVRWPKADGWHRCAGSAVRQTGFCRKHAERLGLVCPPIRFIRRLAHQNGTGDHVRSGELSSAAPCGACSRTIGAGEIIMPARRNGTQEAICKDCAGIHESPYQPGFSHQEARYLIGRRVDGCSACEREQTYRVGEACPSCGGTGYIREMPE